MLFSDRLNLAVLLLQAPLIAQVVGLIFDTAGSPLEPAQAKSQIAFVLVLSAIWFGCIDSARKRLASSLIGGELDLDLG